jgi:AsmA protein
LSTARKGMIALGGLLLLATAAYMSLPWIASTQLVRDRITTQLSLWSGYRVSIGEAPILDVWPGFKATLNNVAFHQWADTSTPPVLEADRLDVSLSAWAALRGNVEMSAVAMHRPLLRLTVDGSTIDLPASPGGGRMTRALDIAKVVVSNNPTNPDTSALPSDAFGTLEFSEGRIVVVNGDSEDGISSLIGRIVWPSLDRTARINATGIWRGEHITLDTTTQPLLLLAGGNAPFKASLKSNLVEASFDGQTNLSGDAFLDGEASFASSSLRRMLEWSRIDIAPGAAIGAMSISSKIQGNAQRLRLDSVKLSLGGTTGNGVIEVAFASPTPAISGTLAFDKFDLRSFLSAFTPIASGGGNIYDKIDTTFSEQLSLDLRLSAPTASLGAITLTNLAAAAQIKGNLAAFDISGAEGFDGDLQAGIRIDANEENKTVEFRVSANDLDAVAFSKAIGAERIVPQGRATFTMMLKGAGLDWNTVMGNAEGTVSASIGQGSVQGIDLSKLRRRLDASGFFPIAEVGDGALPFKSFDFKAKVIGGVAHVEKANFQLDNQLLSLSGFSPYFSRSLALSGHFSSPVAEGEAGSIESPFFIGGSWDTPFITPAWSVPDFE